MASESPDPGPAFLARLVAARGRLAAHAASGAHAGLTGADPATGERWDAGQVWAHLAEFPAYWVGQFEAILAARADGATEPIPFGRPRTDPGRVGPIERDRHEAPALLHERVQADIDAFEAFLGRLRPVDWSVTGLHPTLGELALPAMVERFVVGHLEEHADQLDELMAPTA
ncbi:MAG TPA: hypothetical protein VK592_05905 [Candidatus Dormibacteraeota bacterium]|nr:hypothetical protein [Candidatus Dormibacteraeota bacterium]